MKNTKFAKISLLVLSLALVLGAAFATSINAETEPAKPEITSQNVLYTDQFALMFAVVADPTVTSVTLNVYEAHPYTGVAAVDTITKTEMVLKDNSGLPYDAYIFTIDGVWATDMAKEFYVQAVDSNSNASNIKKYSIAEYLYERLSGSKVISEVQEEFYNDTIEFGSNAQELFNKNETLISDLRYVVVEGGTINGASVALCPAGELVKPVPDAIKANWNVTVINKAGETAEPVLAEGTFTVAEDSKKTVVSIIKEGTAYKPYRENVNTFEAKTPDSEFEYPISGMAEVQYVYDKDYGMVAYAKLKADASTGGPSTGASSEVCIKPTEKYLAEGVTSAEEAKALEVSFNIKLLGMSSDANLYATLWSRTPSSYSTFANVRTYICNNGGNLKFRQNTQSWVYTDTGLKFDGEWMHIRLVISAGDTHYYWYINGSDTPVKQKITSTAFSNLQNIENLRFFIETQQVGTTVDKVFIPKDPTEYNLGNGAKNGMGFMMDNVIFYYTNEVPAAQ